jgi:hypothetical protein
VPDLLAPRFGRLTACAGAPPGTMASMIHTNGRPGLIGCSWAALLLAGCGAPAMIGPEPNEPSTAAQATGADQHLAAALREEARITQHERLFDPTAKQTIRRCERVPDGADLDIPECWLETVNPTAIHDAEVRMHSDRAAFHRKAARDLHAAEAQACAGILEGRREDNPFERGRVMGVTLLERTAPNNKKPTPLGAAVVLQPISGVTAAELQRILDCYSAHQAAIGYGPMTASADRSPLQEPGSRATVRALRHAFVIEVRADEPFAAQAIWLRAQRLAATR